MDMDTSDYFAYKKNKLNKAEGKKIQKPDSKFSFLIQLFIATFIIIFIVMVIGIMKYSSKIDIEYANNDLTANVSQKSSDNSEYPAPVEEEQQKRIDKRLNIIQQEENAPSEARIISKDKNHQEVIDPVHLESNKKIDRLSKIEKLKAQQNLEYEQSKNAEHKSEQKESKQESPKEAKLLAKKTASIEPSLHEKNVIIMSKVLVGRFPTFEEAQSKQEEIKNADPTSSPYVRKIGNVFAVQLGSHQDFSVARAQAQILKSRGYDVWIYQQ